MEPLLLTNPEQRGHKIALHQRVAARDGDAAARALVVALVPPDDLHALFHRHRLAPLLEGIGGALLRADQTIPALCPINGSQPARRKAEDLALGAAVLAGAAGFAANAFGAVNAHLGLQRPAFGVGAPLAPQGTAFQEEFRPHAGAVVDGKALDIEDDAGILHSRSPLFFSLFFLRLFLLRFYQMPPGRTSGQSVDFI